MMPEGKRIWGSHCRELIGDTFSTQNVGPWAVSAKGSLGVLNSGLYREERILQTSVLQASGEDDRSEVPIDPIPVARQSKDIYWLVCISVLSWTILSLTEMPLFSRLTVH